MFIILNISLHITLYHQQHSLKISSLKLINLLKAFLRFTSDATLSKILVVALIV